MSLISTFSCITVRLTLIEFPHNICIIVSSFVVSNHILINPSFIFDKCAKLYQTTIQTINYSRWNFVEDGYSLIRPSSCPVNLMFFKIKARQLKLLKSFKHYKCFGIFRRNDAWLRSIPLSAFLLMRLCFLSPVFIFFLLPWLVHHPSLKTLSSRGPVSTPTTSSFRILHQNVLVSQTHPLAVRKTWQMKTCNQ